MSIVKHTKNTTKNLIVFRISGVIKGIKQVIEKKFTSYTDAYNYALLFFESDQTCVEKIRDDTWI